MRKPLSLFALPFVVLVGCGTSSKAPRDIPLHQDTRGDTEGFGETSKDSVVHDVSLEGAIDEISEQGSEDIPPDTPPLYDYPQCSPPSFPSNCAEVEEFETGLEAWCREGIVEAHWYHRWLCEEQWVTSEFECSYKCPYGCKDLVSDDRYWPQNGQELVAHYCAECIQPSDCEGREHPACVGEWKCVGGVCVWECESGCVGEGEYVPVVPDAPECCEGLVKVSCDTPDEHGKCQPCAGASVCTKCYDGVCGIGENKCNCPEDCKTCLEIGEVFVDFDTQGKCCEGLVAKSDCELTYDGCSCPKCPCHICLPCGDGLCGPFEHRCNCPEDCPEDFKCVETYRSACEGDPYGADKKGELKLEVRGHDIIFRHEKVALNCCLETTVCFAPYQGSLEIVERRGGNTPCFCECLFTIEAKIEGIKSGDYNYAVYNEEHGATLFEGTLTVP